MPTDYELYYGFTRFAIELNELCPELKDVLPRTDTRFRPDQRYDSGCPLHASQLLKSDTWLMQIPGRRKPGNGVFREAAYRRSAANQEEVERGEQRQT